MKRIKILFILLVLFTITGCKMQKLSNDNYYKNLKTILNQNVKYSNQDAIGYQYYLPQGINVIEVNDFNETLFSHGNKYYLYADAVSYYHKVKSKYKVNKSAYISKKLNYNKKKGYLEVNKDNGKYYVQMMFNYAKMEGYVSKDDLTDTITNMAYILSSVKYNKSVVDTLLGSKKYDLSDSEVYNIFNTKKSSNEDQFLKYVNEYDDYNGNAEDLIEQEEIETESEE